MRLVSVLVLVACGGRTPPVEEVKATVDKDPDGPNRARIAAHVQPLVDAELVSGIVVGITDGGRREIYGFGTGPGGTPPTGTTLFELGSVTKAYTGLLLADAVQRREVALDQPLAELLPTGVTAPTRDKQVITLRHLILHSSGLPPLPPSLNGTPENPFATYSENLLYQDLVRTQLIAPPGTRIFVSDYGVGLLAHELGRKVGGGYPAALKARVLTPLSLDDTYFTVPESARPRVATGTTDDLAPAQPWTYDALAGTGGLVSTVRDQLAFLEAQIEADAGSKLPLRPAMRLTQEPQLQGGGDNEGIGWQIDSGGRYWAGGSTGGYHAVMSFDPKQRRGVVILASTRLSLVDSTALAIHRVLANEDIKPPVFPDAAKLATFAGTYDFQGTRLNVTAAGKRLYMQSPEDPVKYRLLPISEQRFWIEALASGVSFEKEGDKIKRAVFVFKGTPIAAPRVE